MPTNSTSPLQMRQHRAACPTKNLLRKLQNKNGHKPPNKPRQAKAVTNGSLFAGNWGGSSPLFCEQVADAARWRPAKAGGTIPSLDQLGCVGLCLAQDTVPKPFGATSEKMALLIYKGVF